MAENSLENLPTLYSNILQKINLRGLSQKFPDKPKIAETSGDICYIFQAFYPTLIMGANIKFFEELVMSPPIVYIVKQVGFLS